MTSLLRNGFLTLLLSLALVVALVAIPADNLDPCADSVAAAATTPTWSVRVDSVARRVVRGHLPCASQLTGSDSLFADLPHLLRTSGALVLTTMLLVILIAVPAGIAAGRDRHNAWARSAGRLIQTLSSLPVIVWATAIFALAFRSGQSVMTNPWVTFTAAVVTLLLGDRLLGDVHDRVARSTHELLAEPHIRTVRAAGFSMRRHLVQGLVPPVADAIASRTLLLVGGAIVAERLYGIRGLGSLVFDALKSNPMEREVIVVSTVALVTLGIMMRAVAEGAAVLADGRRRM